MIAVLLTAACGSDRTGESASGATAGAVVEVDGEVTALRAAAGSTARTLNAGAAIYADDTVTTADTASVTIELSHNGARWSLTGGVSRRVDRSPAWRAAKSSGGQLLSSTEQDRTAAAGRHAERTAAERTATPPIEAMEREEETAEPEAPAEVAAMEEAAPARAAKRRPSPAPAPSSAPPPSPEPEPEPEAAAAPPPPPPPPPQDEPVMKEATRKKSKRSSRRVGGASTGALRAKSTDEDIDDLIVKDDAKAPPKLTREQVLSTVSRMRAALARCSAEHDGKGKTVKVAFVVAPDGRARNAKAQSPHAGTPLGRCVETTVEQTRFPKAAQDTPITFPFRL